MRKLLLLLLLGLGPPLWAQPQPAQLTGTITGTQCISVPVSNRATMTFQVTGGSWTGTIQPQGIINGGAAVNIQVTPVASSTPQSTVTANGMYSTSVAGMDTFQLCGATVTNTATVNGNAIAAAVKNGTVGSGGGGGGGGSGTVTSVLGTANQIASDGNTVTPTLSIPSTFVAPGSASATSLSCGILNTTACVLTGYGSTSGTATFTWPAVAGTRTNNVVSSNGLQVPVGATSTPSLAIGTTANGFFENTNAVYGTSNAATGMVFTSTTFNIPPASAYTFASAADLTANGPDTGMSRSAADVTAFGNGTPGNTTGKLKASGYISVGTKFTTNNGCTDGANVGGATAGEFVVGSTSCTEVITMGDSATAPNGWDCHAYDKTTLADVTNPHQTTSTTTTATIVTGTVVSGDHIAFSCMGY